MNEQSTEISKETTSLVESIVELIESVKNFKEKKNKTRNDEIKRIESVL